MSREKVLVPRLRHANAPDRWRRANYGGLHDLGCRVACWLVNVHDVYGVVLASRRSASIRWSRLGVGVTGQYVARAGNTISHGVSQEFTRLHRFSA
jgi:hypothetical protein